MGGLTPPRGSFAGCSFPGWVPAAQLSRGVALRALLVASNLLKLQSPRDPPAPGPGAPPGLLRHF